MKNLPTDLQILECIYSEYGSVFRNYINGEPNSRNTLIYVPIDTRHIAKSLKTDPHVLFGRLYYHLDHKYRYTEHDDSMVPLFALQVGGDRHCVNYPYLAGILAEYRAERRKHLWSIWLSFFALVFSLATIIAQIVTAK